MGIDHNHNNHHCYIVLAMIPLIVSSEREDKIESPLYVAGCRFSMLLSEEERWLFSEKRTSSSHLCGLVFGPVPKHEV